MTPTTFIEILRWVFLITTVMNILGVTILYRSLGRPLLNWYWDCFAVFGSTIPPFLRNATVHRIWGAFGAIVFFLLWWYLGTPEGHKLAISLFNPLFQSQR